jgi:hypothetical protein
MFLISLNSFLKYCYNVFFKYVYYKIISIIKLYITNFEFQLLI